MSRQQQNYIPGQQNNNVMNMMQKYQQFKKDYYEQNPNPDPKSAVMQMVQNGQIGNPQLQQAMSIAQMFGCRF